MGLHAYYYPISSTTLANFLANWHSENCWAAVSRFRQEVKDSGQRFYIGTTWHALDRIINPPETGIPELLYAVRGHGFPAPDGTIHAEPPLPSYSNEYWQSFTYVTAEEVAIVAPYLSLIDRAEFNSRFAVKNLKGVYRAPRIEKETQEEYFELLGRLQAFYQQVANDGLAVLMVIA